MNAITIRVNAKSVLPDGPLWTNRLEIHSQTSDRIYVIAQNKARRHWGCSCPGYRRHRKCKHLETLRLPCYEKPCEVNMEKR